eukprot:TRINITY_DN45953_c0_g1_i3.p1 TRINITY_DN45953_c0_g1~~TRINITY_DN45953_c0_g1_i3.p1  ORF type:complete len:143 (-),score=29.08 TRINITY_DN45953_c0_g1_i3:340-768(-)
MIRRPPRSTLSSSSAASDVYKRQVSTQSTGARFSAMPALAPSAPLGKLSRVLGGDLPLLKHQDVVNGAHSALDKTKSDQECAKMIKEEWEKKEKGAWHVIVGSSFGSNVSHETGTLLMINASVPLPDAPFRKERYILLFKHG